MSTQNPQRNRELVFCHSCENEWFRDEHGLICPECQSDIVEIIEENTDPRAEREAPPIPEHTHPFSAFNNHNPWDDFHQGDDAPDPDEDDVSRVEYTRVNRSGPFFRTTIHGPSGTFTWQTGGNVTRVGGGGHGPPMGFDPFGNMLQSFLGVPTQHHNHGGLGESTEAGRSPLQDSPGMRSNVRVTGNPGMDDISGILSSFMGAGPPRTPAGGPGPGGGLGGGPGGGGQGMPPGLHLILSQLFNPGNAQMGDAVFSNEALDRVITQLMEQHGGSTAPGPASEAAISALPHVAITKEQQDNDGKAECSICMETVPLGDYVTELPCKHWFHEACVGSWLREHDTCPQCRRGITPKEGDGNTPRATGEAPRHWQFPDELRRQNSGGFQGQGTPSSPIQIPSSPDAGPSVSGSPSRTRDGRSGIASGIAGWMGRLTGRNNNSSDNGEGNGNHHGSSQSS